MPCPRCQIAIAEGARFCARCGTTLVADVTSPAERRQLTVLFCDLVGSTALSVRLDPEDLREVMRAYQEYVGETVARFGGFCRSTRATASWCISAGRRPRARRRAGRAHRPGAGRRSDEHAWPLGVELAIRVGVATGLVLVESRDIAGDTPNLAARLQTQAEPNTVVIAQATLSLVRGLFDYRDLGARPLKGFGEPVPVWQVLRESSKAASRFDALRGRSLGALLGRKRSSTCCCAAGRRPRRAPAGSCCSRVAGIGKSPAGARADRKRRRTAPAAALFLLAASHR